MKDAIVFICLVIVIPVMLITLMLLVMNYKKSQCAICNEQFNQFNIQTLNTDEISINVCDNCLKNMILEKITK